MRRSIAARVVVCALAGAAIAAALLPVVLGVRASVVLDMDRNQPALTDGFYPVERAGDETFAWTSADAAVAFAGLDRRVAWTCTVRMRGAHPPRLPQPTVALAVDGVVRESRAAGQSYEDWHVDLPATDTPGLVLTISTRPAFTPGPADRRTLGAQVDRITCRPDGFALPPRRASSAAAVAGLVIGAAVSGALPAWPAMVVITAACTAMAVAIATSPGPYDAGYLATLPPLAAWIAGASWVVTWLRARRRTLASAARLAIVLSAGTLFVELAALLHPAKPLVDALFHAHRLEWVLHGRYFFTQPMPDGVSFPYAIGLYVVAAPWAAFTANHVALLKIVVSTARAVAGLSLYPLIAASWDDRRTACAAVALFHLAPLPFVVIGNANLTYAFAHSAAVIAIAAAGTWPLARRGTAHAAAFGAVCALAFLSHVGIFPLLFVVLIASGVLYVIRGGPALRRAGIALGLTTILAGVVSIVLYYGHFTDSYRSLARVRADRAASAPAGSTHRKTRPDAPQGAAPGAAPGVAVRAVRAGGLAVTGYGWSILALAAIGAFRTWRSEARDRLGLLVAASALAYVAFVGFSVVTPIEPRFLRYTEEFISRVNYAMVPAVIVLAARGAVSTRPANLASRVVSTILAAAALYTGARAWLAWLP